MLPPNLCEKTLHTSLSQFAGTIFYILHIYTSSPFLVFLQYLSLGNYGNPPDDNRTTTKDNRRTTKDDSDIWREGEYKVRRTTRTIASET